MSSTFESGTYYMRNYKSGTVIDLHGGDYKTLIEFPYHGYENQQWEFGPSGDGWYIRSVHKGRSYFTIEESLGDGAPVTTSHYPAPWAVEPTDEVNVFRIMWPKTNLSIDLDGGKITARTYAIGMIQQLWRLERVPNRPKALPSACAPPSSVAASCDTETLCEEPEEQDKEQDKEQDSGGVSTSTVTTTADKVTTVTTTITVKTANIAE